MTKYINQRTYYNAVQLSLPLNLEISLDSTDPVFTFLEVMEGVDLSHYVKPIASNNTKSHDRGMLLKVVLFAYAEGHRGLRDIEHLCRTDIRYMMLSNEERPSFMSFQRMMNDLKEDIDHVFRDITARIAMDLMDIDVNVQYVDGTKIEANANKNTFVYKKRIINAMEKMNGEITESITRLNDRYGYHYETKSTYDSFDVGFISQYMMENMVAMGIEPVYGRGHPKKEMQKDYDMFLKYYSRMLEYERWLAIMGDRKSCSKTDWDATFMATKWDYYNRSGLTRACYNCQIAVSDGIVINSDVYQNPGDASTWTEMMERNHELYGFYPRYPVADAGYGGYDNYLYNIGHGIELVQKFSMYGKESDNKFKKRTYVTFNWETDEKGYKICPDGRTFDQKGNDHQEISRNGNLIIRQTYYERNRCKGCSRKNECIKGGSYKRLSRNVILEEMHDKVRENLGSEQGKEFKKQRSIQVEGTFGVIKQDMKFNRFTRKGMKNVKMEFLLVCLGYNFKKYHLHRMKNNRYQEKPLS